MIDDVSQYKQLNVRTVAFTDRLTSENNPGNDKTYKNKVKYKLNLE